MVCEISGCFLMELAALIPMVLRMVSRGEHLGKQFFACPNYPNFRAELPLPADPKPNKLEI